MECVKCKIQKDRSKFRKYSETSIRSICKQCDNEDDKERKKKARKKRLETTIVKCSRCEEEKKLADFSILKKYDKKVCLACYPKYLTDCKTKWCSEERKNNPNYRIKKSLAARLRTVLTKTNSTMNYIGCNIQYLREWFEYNFTHEMNWDNYGSYWSIDHVIPVNSFDLTVEKEKYECWNWTNLVPFPVKNNSSKRNNIIETQILNIRQKILKFKEEGSTTKWFSSDNCVVLRYSLALAEK